MAAPSPYPRPYGSYLLLEPLGQGGMSEVELARKAVDDARYVRFVVIKRIHARHTAEPGFIRMFQDEARINAELQHENIAQVYDFGHVGDEWYLAMEYVPGLDLRGVLRRTEARGERLPVPIAARIVCDVLKALQYAHGRVDTYGRPMNIVHRDVNPRNVMVSVRGEVKLIDFGVAKADTRNEHTKGEVIKGKFAYMAPEQIESGGPVDGRADVFAVALMLYELLAGEHPFAGLREIQIVHRVLAGRIPVLPSAPGDNDPVRLRAVIRKALAMQPADRYTDADAFRTALESAAQDYGGLATGPELAAFVRELDPGRAEGISERLEAWRDLQDPSEDTLSERTTQAIFAAPAPAPAPAPPPVVERSDAKAPTTFILETEDSNPTLADHPPVRQSRLPWVLAGGAVAAVTLAAVAGLAVVLLLPDPSSKPDGNTPLPPNEPAPTLAAPEVESPEPTPAPRQESRPKPEPRPKAKSANPRPRPPAPTPAPSVEPAASPAPEAAEPRPPSPSTAPAAPEAAPSDADVESTPEPALPAEPVAEDTLVYITSAERGRQVWIDGKEVGVTSLELYVSEGPHEVRVVDPKTGASWSRTVIIDKKSQNLHKIGE